MGIIVFSFSSPSSSLSTWVISMVQGLFLPMRSYSAQENGTMVSVKVSKVTGIINNNKVNK